MRDGDLQLVTCKFYLPPNIQDLTNKSSRAQTLSQVCRLFLSFCPSCCKPYLIPGKDAWFKQQKGRTYMGESLFERSVGHALLGL